MPLRPTASWWKSLSCAAAVVLGLEAHSHLLSRMTLQCIIVCNLAAMSHVYRERGGEAEEMLPLRGRSVPPDARGSLATKNSSTSFTVLVI